MANEAEMDGFKHSETPAEEKGIKHYFRKLFTSPLYLIALIAMIFLFLWLRNAVTELPTFWLLVTIIIIGIFMWQAIYWKAKHDTPKIIASQFFSTVLPEPTTTVGPWDIWACGSIYVGWFPPLQGKEATLIVPRAAHNKIGRCHAYPTRLWFYPYNLLPPQLRKALSQFNCNTQKILLGLIDDSQMNQTLSPEKLLKIKESGLDDKALKELTTLQNIPLSALEDIVIKSFAINNAYEAQLDATSQALETTASRIRRYGTLKDRTTVDKAVDVLAGRRNRDEE